MIDKTKVTARSSELKEFGPLSQRITIRLRTLDYLLNRGISKATDGLVLRTGTIGALGLIVANPGITQNQIAKHTSVDKSTMVYIINHLEKLGWAFRTQSKTDKRKYALMATLKGESILYKISETVEEMENTLLSNISKEEISTLSDLLDRAYISCLTVLDQD